MVRKRDYRRHRRVQLVSGGGAIAVLIGGLGSVAAFADAIQHRPGGWQGVAICVPVVAAGSAAVSWAARALRRAASEDRIELAVSGHDDGLPVGAFVGERGVGLEASDIWLLCAGVAAFLAALFAVVGATDSTLGWKVGLVLGSCFAVPGALCLWAGTGTKYWLTPEGIETNGWPRRAVRWADVGRIVPLTNGMPSGSSPIGANAYELQTAKPVSGWPRWTGVTDFPVKIMLLEIRSDALLSMIQERVALAHDAERPAASG